MSSSEPTDRHTLVAKLVARSVLEEWSPSKILGVWDQVRVRLYPYRAEPEALIRFAGELHDLETEMLEKETLGSPARFTTSQVLVRLAQSFEEDGRLDCLRTATRLARQYRHAFTPEWVMHLLVRLESRAGAKSVEVVREQGAETRDTDRRARRLRFLPLQDALRAAGDPDVRPNFAVLLRLPRAVPEFKMEKAGYGLVFPPERSDSTKVGVAQPSLCVVMVPFFDQAKGGREVGLSVDDLLKYISQDLVKLPSGDALRRRFSDASALLNKLGIGRFEEEGKGKRVLRAVAPLWMHGL